MTLKIKKVITCFSQNTSKRHLVYRVKLNLCMINDALARNIHRVIDINPNLSPFFQKMKFLLTQEQLRNKDIRVIPLFLGLE